MPPQAFRVMAQDKLREAVKERKRPSKRKQRVPNNVIIQSQYDGDEIVWKVSPTAQRLESAATREIPHLAVGGSRLALDPCENFPPKSEAVHEILLKASTCSPNHPKKKKSPGMAGKLEQWLLSSQQVNVSKPLVSGKDVNDENKENIPDGYTVNHADSKKASTPVKSKARASASKRPSTSSRKRSLGTQKSANNFSKSRTKHLGQSRKALLDLLDKVDDALVVKRPSLIQSKLSLNLTLITSPGKNLCGNEPETTGKLDRPHLETAVPLSPQQVLTTSTKDSALHVASVVSHQCILPQAGDCDKEVLKKVQVLGLSNECTSLRQSTPLVADQVSPGECEVGKHISHQHTSCRPGEEPENRLASIHFLVLEVTDGHHDAGLSLSYPQKSLHLLNEHNGLERTVHLRDTWCHADVIPGDMVNVIGEFDIDGTCVIDREHNLLVVNPDLLVSGSKVGSSFLCPRRAILDERIKSNETSYPALMGTMLHQLFQGALRSDSPTSSLLTSEAKLIVQRQLDGLYAVGVSEKEACMKLVDAIPTILSWRQHYFGTNMSAAQEIEFGNRHGRQPVAISKILDIEEMVWSPKYGLKGMIDASITVKMGNMSLGGEGQIMPLELKTGKATTGQAATEHRAQVILYTLLMSDRYTQNVEAGLLYYLHTNQTQGVEVHHAELVGLMMRRNEHASNILKASNQSLPPMLQNYQMCQSCRQLDACTLYHKAQESGTGESSGLGDLFDQYTNHMSKKHIQFFQQWDRMIDLESQNILVSHSEIWRMPSRKREEQGRCISSLVLDMSANIFAEQKNLDSDFIYCFQRSSTSSVTSSQEVITQSHLGSLRDTPFSCGDYVLLSSESGQVAVGGGTILTIQENSIVLRLPHRLQIPMSRTTSRSRSPQEVWRIDKDETASSLAIMRFNLLQLFANSDADEQRRRLIVDLKAPMFESGPVSDLDPAALYLRSASDLNDDQRRAISKIIAAKDYALILGMPGTGKTSTIVHAVIALLARKSSVLLTSYTNSAVDNILLKLKKVGVDFVRVGRKEAIHPDLQENTLCGGISVTSVKEYESVVEQAQVVGVTCLGVTHALFGKRKFDVCIVDEAGQITLPAILGPLRCAHTFVLVGDHYQLPPLVRSLEARDKGMQVSLFRRLSEAHPQSCSALQCQYRMCSDIMALSNSLIYSNRLSCGSPAVADASLNVHKSLKQLPSWLLQVVNPMQRVLFLDTDGLSAEESRVRNKIHNGTEASVILRIIQALTDGGVDINHIGVISPYNAQVDLIQRITANAGFSNLEVQTVDKYQGQEKDCVLISFVRCNSQHQISGSLLADWHRINVAVTRAKKKFLMIGSQKTLSSTPVLRLLIEKVAEVGGLLPLPQNAIINTQ